MTKPEKQKNPEIGNMLFILVLMFLFSTVSFFYTWRNIHFANVLYEITKLKKEKKVVYKEVEDLRLRVANYSNPERIEKLYRDRMGYFPVTAGDRIVSLKLPEVIIPQAFSENPNIGSKEDEGSTNPDPEENKEEDLEELLDQLPRE